ncbi:MAG: hypothetical protein RI958_1067 [Actinomycetota bacterium]
MIDWRGHCRLALLVSMVAAVAAIVLTPVIGSTAVIVTVIVGGTCASWFLLERSDRAVRPTPTQPPPDRLV